MFKINRLRVEILSDKSKDINKLFGFDYAFHQGLNIVAGMNSKGKTTINSCIYYGLGMEELLGGHNEKALDKALKEQFSVIEGEELINYRVFSSKVLLEIENTKGEVVTIIRYIKSEYNKTNIVEVFSSSISSYDKDDANRIFLFVSGRGNNDSEEGIYTWLARFIEIDIPIVSNTSKADNKSPLYLQTIFATFFIEQTKGWSDFFATMPFYGIPRVKEKNVEFLLKLNELSLSTQKDILNKKKKEILDDWEDTIKSFKIIEGQFNMQIENIPSNITKENAVLNLIKGWFSISEDERVSLESNIEIKKQELKIMEDSPIATIEDGRDELLAEYKAEKESYSKLKNYIDQVWEKLNLQKIQQTNLSSQLITIEDEIKKHKSLEKVFNESIINRTGGNYCPTCSQEVSIDLISSKDISIPKLGLSENIGFLKSQKRMVETTLSSLDEKIKERSTLLIYFNTSLRKKEALIKKMSKDLISDDRAFSEVQVLKKIQIEKEIEDLTFILEEIMKKKDYLIDLANKDHNNELEFSKLSESESEDEKTLNFFELKYKELLYQFGYDSNEQYKISINRSQPFKYFPVYRNYQNETAPQSIRINSSASDFVRNIWAYTIALLKYGTNHPGLVILDEPGQHRTNISSLKALLKECEKLKDKQIIIFTSIDKQLNEEESLDLGVLISELKEENYYLIRLNDNTKVIGPLAS